MKRKRGNYLQLSWRLFNDDELNKLTINAKWLYVVLNELEHKYTGPSVYGKIKIQRMAS